MTASDPRPITTPAPAEPRFLARLEVLGELANRDFVLRSVSSVCRSTLQRFAGTVSAETITAHVVSAVGEAFNNIALHGYKGEPPGRVIVELGLVGMVLTIHISDYGTGYDPDRVAEPDLAALPESGLGVFIVKSFVDEFRYERGTPNVLRLSKRIS